MQMSESNSDLCNHKPRLIISESPDLDEMPKQLSSFYEVHQEEYSLLVLKHVVHPNNERMLDVIQNLFFELQRVHLVVL